MSGFGFTISTRYSAVVAVGMWESHAAFERDFSKPLREATAFRFPWRRHFHSRFGLFENLAISLKATH